jgi:transcriptional regulator with XRE-family HTH domain
MTITDAQRLGRLLAKARAKTGLSTTQLAEAVAVNQSNIVRLEQGQITSPTPALLQRLADRLDLPLNQLYELAGIPLPGLHAYLRTSYGLSEADIARTQEYIDRLAASYGSDGRGPDDGADEAPEDN